MDTRPRHGPVDPPAWGHAGGDWDTRGDTWGWGRCTQGVRKALKSDGDQCPGLMVAAWVPLGLWYECPHVVSPTGIGCHCHCDRPSCAHAPSAAPNPLVL